MVIHTELPFDNINIDYNKKRLGLLEDYAVYRQKGATPFCISR